MRRITIAAGLILALTSSYAPAGQVLFDPPEVAFDPNEPDRVYEFAVTVASEPGGAVAATGLDMVIEKGVMDLFDFQYARLFLDAAGPFVTNPFQCGILGCPDEPYLGAFFQSPLPLPLDVGTLSARFPAGFEDRMTDLPEYAIYVDTALGGGLNNLNGTEPLAGHVRLIPEPATLILLLAGMLALARRSRTVVAPIS